MSLRDKIQATLSKCRSLGEMIDILKAATGNGDDTEFETQIVGEIPAAIAEKVPQLIAAPIILDKSGVDHIAVGREKVLKNLKMTAVEFVKSIIDGFDRIYTNKDYTDRFQLVCTSKTTSRLAVIGIKKEGNIYRVITAMPKRNARLSKETLLWEGAANLHAVSAATTPPLDVNSDKVASGENINNSDPNVNSENEKIFEKLKKAAENNPFIANHIRDMVKAKARQEEAFKFGPRSKQWKEWEDLNASLWGGREDEFLGQYFINTLGERKTTVIGKGDEPGALKALEVSTVFQWRQTYDRTKQEFGNVDSIGERDREIIIPCSMFLKNMLEYLLDKPKLDALFEEKYIQKIKECHVLESARYA